MQQWQRLCANLRGLAPQQGLCIALSGGLDSRFLVHTALRAGVDVWALHVAGVHIPQKETAWVRAWAERVHLPLKVLTLNVLLLDSVHTNSRDRCYECKSFIFEQLREHAGNRILCDGSNADDMGAYRPGLKALREQGVRSPLAEWGLTKNDIRALAAATGLENPHQAARPCLLTRLAYGMTPDTDTLARIETAENALELLGLTDFRLRLTPEPLLQTLLLTPEHRAAVMATLAKHGFIGVRLLEEARMSGYFDRI